MPKKKLTQLAEEYGIPFEEALDLDIFIVPSGYTLYAALMLPSGFLSILIITSYSLLLLLVCLLRTVFLLLRQLFSCEL